MRNRLNLAGRCATARRQRHSILSSEISARKLTRVGMAVVVMEDSGKESLSETTSLPWQLGNNDGMWVVKLKGKSGGFDAARVSPLPGTCRVCGCTDEDCRQCIEKTGQPCSWIDREHTLCSACEEVAA